MHPAAGILMINALETRGRKPVFKDSKYLDNPDRAEMNTNDKVRVNGIPESQIDPSVSPGEDKQPWKVDFDEDRRISRVESDFTRIELNLVEASLSINGIISNISRAIR